MYARGMPAISGSFANDGVLPAGRYARTSAQEDKQVQGASDAAMSASHDVRAYAVRSASLSSSGVWPGWVSSAVSASGSLVLIPGWFHGRAFTDQYRPPGKDAFPWAALDHGRYFFFLFSSSVPTLALGFLAFSSVGLSGFSSGTLMPSSRSVKDFQNAAYSPACSRIMSRACLA